jgi:hypothetical protein
MEMDVRHRRGLACQAGFIKVVFGRWPKSFIPQSLVGDTWIEHVTPAV